MSELQITPESMDTTNIFAAFGSNIVDEVRNTVQPELISALVLKERDRLLSLCREKAHEAIRSAMHIQQVSAQEIQVSLQKPENLFLRRIMAQIPAQIDLSTPYTLDRFISAIYYCAFTPKDESKNPLFVSFEDECDFLAKYAYEVELLDPTNKFATELINQLESLKQQELLKTELLGETEEKDLVSEASKITFQDVYVVPMDVANDEIKTARVKPMHAHQEQATLINDTMKNNLVPIITSREWRDNGMPRDKLVCVTEFDYSTLGLDVGRAGFLLVGPQITDDIRIEVKSQNSPGTAGDKLPTAMRRLSNASRVRAYGKVVVGVLGGPLFSKEALEMAREESAKNNRVQLVEGVENLQDTLTEEIATVRGKHLLAQHQLEKVQHVTIPEVETSTPEI